MAIKTILLCMIIVHAYLLVGAAIFFFQEFSNLPKRQFVNNSGRNITTLFEDFQKENAETNGTLGINEFITYLEEKELENKTAKLTTREAFLTSYCFSASILSTIGYGNVAPITPLGKWAVIIYSAVGMPLCVVALATTGRFLANYVAILCSIFFKILEIKPTNKSAKMRELVLLIFCGIVLFLVLPSVVYASLEGWTYSDSFYYAFTTGSTIGLGDFVPGICKGNIDDFSITTQILYIPFTAVVTGCSLSWLATVATITKDILESIMLKNENNSQNMTMR